jgi:hypothetical protein
MLPALYLIIANLILLKHQFFREYENFGSGSRAAGRASFSKAAV